MKPNASLFAAVVLFVACFLCVYFTYVRKQPRYYREARPSPNYDERPASIAIDTLVLHATERNSLEEVIDHFKSPVSRVSSHYTIDRDGSVVQHVDERFRAWHAGVSRMPDGRERVNDFSIGIELVNLNNGTDVYLPEQLQSLRELIREIVGRWPIRFLVPHSEIAQPVGRKSDPQGLEIAQFRALLGAEP